MLCIKITSLLGKLTLTNWAENEVLTKSSMLQTAHLGHGVPQRQFPIGSSML
jgi:hypothetical protein